MSKSKIPGIPTMYSGIRFRSRLEARWAAFFSILGWKWEYEPFDLNGWIPDFALHGRETVLVEVKPIVWGSDSATEERRTVGKKITDAVRETHASALPMLLVGTSLTGWSAPSGGGGWVDACDTKSIGVGFVQVPEIPTTYQSTNCHLGLCDYAFNRGPRPEPDIGCAVSYRNLSLLQGKPLQLVPFDWAPFDQAWAEACNQVQWKGAR